MLIEELLSALMPRVSALMPGAAVQIQGGKLRIDGHEARIYTRCQRRYITAFRSEPTDKVDAYVGEQRFAHRKAGPDLDEVAAAVVQQHREDLERARAARFRERNAKEFAAIWGGAAADALRRAGIQMSYTSQAMPIHLKLEHTDTTEGMLKLLRLLHEHGWIRSPLHEDGSHADDADIIRAALEPAPRDPYEV